MSGSGPRRTAVFVSPLLPHPPVSGGQKRVLRLMEAAARAGAVPHVLTADATAAPADVDALRARGWGVDVLPEPAPTLRRRMGQHVRRRPSPFLHGVAARLGELVGHAAFVQLEHTQSAYYAPAQVPTILSLHNNDSAMARAAAATRRPFSPAWFREHNRGFELGTVERAAIPRASLVLAVSQADAESVVRRGGRALLVPNGVDPEFFGVPPAAPGCQRVLFFGHFGYAPNVEGLLRFATQGWPRVLAAAPRARLAVAGAGIAPDVTARLAVLPGVEVLGLVGSIAGALTDSAAVVVPLWQGGGTRLKVLEAMASGRPVAGTAFGVGGVGFDPGIHGVVADDAGHLGDALGSLLLQPERRAAMGLAARSHAARYAWESITGPLEAWYASCCTADRTHSPRP